MKSVAPRTITMAQVYAAAFPYVVLGFVMLLAVALWPPLATWLPRTLLGR
jgi:TRAP-type mannitol/chloroaromatic compound transport system permease large subunit